MDSDYAFERNRRYEFPGHQGQKEDTAQYFRSDRPLPNVGNFPAQSGYVPQHGWESSAVPDPYSMKAQLAVPRNEMAYSVVPPSNSDYYPRYPEQASSMSFVPEAVDESYYNRSSNPYAHPSMAQIPSRMAPPPSRFVPPMMPGMPGNGTNIQPNMIPGMAPNMHMQQFVDSYRGMKTNPPALNVAGVGGSNAQGRAINKYLLDILRDRVVDGQRLDMLIDTYVERMDCVNLATLLFHTGKKRLVLIPTYVRRVAQRFLILKEELRAREASNALYGLKCLSSDIPEVRELVHALASKIAASNSDFVAQAVGNALYGLQMMTSEYEEVRYLLLVLASKVSRCTELLEAQNVGNALYGMRGMNSDHKEVRIMISALTPKVASAREELNGQALGNSLYGLQCMSSKEAEIRCLLQVLAAKVTRTWEDLKAQEVGNALYGLKRMSTDVPEVRMLIMALVPKIAQSPDVLDAQAVGNSLYGLQNMRSDSQEVLSLLSVLAEKIAVSCAELDGQAMGNSLYGLQGMSSDFAEVRAVLTALTVKIQSSCLEMNAQELGNALYGLHNMNSMYKEVRKVIAALAQKVAASKHELTSQEIGNAMFGLQNMSSEHAETRVLLQHLTHKIVQSHTVLDPQGVSNSLFGLQRLSSECMEVRHLCHALAYKVEHCWKLLGAHHVANACFGLQSLSSEEKEVLLILKALVPKIVACREEMNAKQLSHAIFGLHKMSSNHMEVLALVTALAEKISMSNDSWNSYYLSLSLFGLQGLSSTSEEVTLLLNVINQKASLASLVDMDPIMLGNCFYGMQRFDSNNMEVCRLLSILTTPLLNLMQYNVKMPPSVVANIIFGVQSFSAHLESVRKVLETVAQMMIDNIAAANFNGLRHDLAVELFMNLLTLYQSAVISIHSIPDLDSYPELKSMLLEKVDSLYAIIEQYNRLYQPRSLTFAETTAAQEISRTLNREPFVIRTGALIFGFDVSVFIQLSPSVDLKTASGSPFNPILGLDVIGTSYANPAKELFHSLRCKYLEKYRGVSMRAVPADAFRSPGQGGLWRHMNVFGPLLPANPEDSAAINNQLSHRSGGPFNYMASISVVDDSVRFSNANFNQPTMGRFGVNEYLDDDYVKPSNDPSEVGAQYNRKPMGMLMGWLGDWPRISSSLLAHLLAMQTNYGRGGVINAPASAPAYPTMTPPTTSPTLMTNRMKAMALPDKRMGIPADMSERGMVPIEHHHHGFKPYSSRSHSADYIGHSSDSTLVVDNAMHMPMRLATINDDGSDTSGDNNNRRSVKPMFDQHHPAIAVPAGSTNSLNGLLSRSYSQFPADDVNRIDTLHYDAAGHFLAPDLNHSNSFVNVNQNFSQYPTKPAVQDLDKQRRLSDASDVDQTIAVIPVNNAGDLAVVLGPGGASLSKEHSNDSVVSNFRDTTTQSTDGDDDEIALLQAQLEMAKLEAKIRSLQNKKAQPSSTSKPSILNPTAAHTLLSNSNDSY